MFEALISLSNSFQDSLYGTLKIVDYDEYNVYFYDLLECYYRFNFVGVDWDQVVRESRKYKKEEETDYGTE